MRFHLTRLFLLTLFAGILPTLAHSQPYVYSKDGSEVIDLMTGLVWRRCSEGTYWDSETCAGAAETFTYPQARQRAHDQAGMAGLAWRLPTVQELKNIVDMDANLDPANGIKLAAANLSVFPQTPADRFWTSTPARQQQNHIAYVDFYDGLKAQKNGARKSRRLYLRLVRTLK